MPRYRYTTTSGVSGVKSNQYLPRFIRASNKRRTRGGTRRAGRKNDSRIALQARLTGYRKAGGNSIPTCTGRGVPSEKLFRVRCRSRRRETNSERSDDATFHFSFSLSLFLRIFLSFFLSNDRLHKKASSSPWGPRVVRRMTSKRHVCGKRRAWRSWSLRIETLRALRPIAPYALHRSPPLPPPFLFPRHCAASLTLVP